MSKRRIIILLFGFLFLSSSAVMAQFATIDAGQLRTYLTGKKHAALVDTRTPEEYQQSHIPGAVNIYPDDMTAKAPRLLKDKKAPVIFYCRGME